jgi:hypothetical protein
VRSVMPWSLVGLYIHCGPVQCIGLIAMYGFGVLPAKSTGVSFLV